MKSLPKVRSKRSHLQRRTTRSLRQRRGATAVEFAIVTPVILLLFLGAVEMTQLNFLRHTAANAAYEGARRAIVPGGSASDANAAAMRMLAAVQAERGSEVQVAEDAERIAVTVILPVQMNSWGISRFTAGYDIVQSCTLSREKVR